MEGEKWEVIVLGIFLVALVMAAVIPRLSIFKKKNSTSQKNHSGGSSGSYQTGPLGPNETDGYQYPTGEKKRGVDYPESWHDANTPGGSLDI